MGAVVQRVPFLSPDCDPEPLQESVKGMQHLPSSSNTGTTVSSGLPTGNHLRVSRVFLRQPRMSRHAKGVKSSAASAFSLATVSPQQSCRGRGVSLNILIMSRLSCDSKCCSVFSPLSSCFFVSSAWQVGHTKQTSWLLPPSGTGGSWRTSQRLPSRALHFAQRCSCFSMSSSFWALGMASRFRTRNSLTNLSPRTPGDSPL